MLIVLKHGLAAAYAIAVRASEYGENDALLEDIVERCVMGVKTRGENESLVGQDMLL